jgi:hypothetical protein
MSPLPTCDPELLAGKYWSFPSGIFIFFHKGGRENREVWKTMIVPLSLAISCSRGNSEFLLE